MSYVVCAGCSAEVSRLRDAHARSHGLEPAAGRIGQTLEGSFSAVSTPIFASKYAFESPRRDLHNALLCTALQSHFFSNFAKILLFFFFAKFSKIFANFAGFSAPEETAELATPGRAIPPGEEGEGPPLSTPQRGARAALPEPRRRRRGAEGSSGSVATSHK